MKKILTAIALYSIANIAFAGFPTNKALNQSLLESSIKCTDNTFSVDLDYYRYPDYACSYDKKTNPIGDTQVFLFPITDKYMPHLPDLSDIAPMENRVNRLSHTELKANFDVFIRVIDKKYLQYVKNLDTPYIVLDNHVTKIYHFNRAKNYWEIVKTNQDIDNDPVKFYQQFKK